MEPKNFPGTGDLDAIAHRSASTAVNHLLDGMALGDVPNDMEFWVQEFLKEMLAEPSAEVGAYFSLDVFRESDAGWKKPKATRLRERVLVPPTREPTPGVATRPRPSVRECSQIVRMRTVRDR